METTSLQELLHVAGMTLGVGVLLGTLILLIHFFTRHMKNILHRILILSLATCIIGILWHFLHPIIHPELKKIDVYIDSSIWIFIFFIAAYLANKLIDKYVWNQIFIDTKKGETLSTSFLRSAISGLIYATFVLLIMLLVFKKEFHLLTTLVGGSTLLLGYAGTDVVKELFAGIALNINPAFKKGDFLKIHDHEAKILDINWRYVVMEDITANLMFIPNTAMLSHIVYNYRGSSNSTRLQVPFHVHPNVPPQMIVDILTTELKQLPHLAARDWYQDNVVIHIKNCDGYSMEFAAEILIDSFENLYEIRTLVYKIIWYTLSQHEVPMYAYSMRVNLPKNNYSKMLELWSPKISKSDIEGLLKKSFLFSVCSKDEIKQLSDHMKLLEFVPQQYLFSEGDKGDVLFLIKSGVVQLTKKMAAEKILVTKILQQFDVVGVNAVMTGKKRERSAIAVTHVQVYAIKRDFMIKMIDKYHDRIQHIADQIVYEEGLREKDFQIYLDKKTQEEEQIHKSIVGQIREFLGVPNAPNL